MERLPEWARTALSVVAFLFLPSIGFVYSQGESAKANEQLALTNTQLAESVKELTNEINILSAKLTTATVKVDYGERRLDKVEQLVMQNAQTIASMKGGGNGYQ